MIKNIISRQNFYRGTVLISVLVLLFNYGSAAALSSAQQQLYSQGINYFDEVGGSGTSDSCTTTPASDTPDGPVATTQDEAQNAETVIGIAKTDGLGQAGALVGLMTAIDESGLQIYSNSNVPISESNPAKQADGNNGDSVGIFQQQPQYDWSTYDTGTPALSDQNAVWQLMDPAYAAEAFFGTPAGATLPAGLVNPGALTKGLQNVSGWQSLAPQVAAQQVQNPGNPPNAGDLTYQSEVEAAEPQAQTLLTQYWNSAPAVPLPIPITGGQEAGGGGTTGTSSNCSTSCTSSGAAATADLSQVRQSVVCIAEQELQLWQSGQLTPNTNSYFKYSQNRAEEWCADFASWVYNQAGYPFGPVDSPTDSWNISYVPDFQAPPQDTSKFTYHAIDSGYTPQPGDLAIHGTQHVNIVISDSDGSLTLIGGDQEPTAGSTFPSNIVSEYSEVDPASDDPPITGYVSPND